MAEFFGSNLDKKPVDRVVLGWLKQLSDEFSVFVELEGGDFQVDFLVVKRDAIFNIEAKNWNVRRAHLDADWELADGRTVLSPVIQAREQSDRVANYLFLQRERFLSRAHAEILVDQKGEFKVFPVVVISSQRSPASVPSHRYFKIFARPDQLKRHLEHFKWEPGLVRGLLFDKAVILALADLWKLYPVDPHTLGRISSDPVRVPVPTAASELSVAVGKIVESTSITVNESPYRYTYTVTGDSFYGRARELEIVRRALISEPPRPVAIQGLQRTGKSSLALESINRYVSQNESCRILKFDFRRLWQEGLKHNEDITKELLTQSSDAAGEGSIERVLDAYREAEAAGAIIDQRRLFAQALRENRQRKKQVVLFLDECQEIAQVLGEDKHKTFFSFIESLCKDDALGLRIVMACRPSFFDLQPIRNINLGRLFDIVTLGPLEESAALPVVERGEQWLHFNPEAKERILFLTGSHPFWLQFLCHRIFERCVLERSDQVDCAFVDDTFAKIVADPGCQPQFYVLYQEIEGIAPAFELLQHIAEVISSEGGCILTSELSSAWQDKSALRAALRPLVDNQMILVENVPQAPALRFRVEALRRWMRPNLITL